jgi:outer membrane protein TolC
MGTRTNPSIPLRIATGILYFLLFVAAFCEDGLAQSNPAPPAQSIVLTLKEAVQLALKQNPQVVALRLLSLESDRQRQIARSALLPQASLTSTGVLAQYNFASIERTSTRTASGIYQYIQAGPTYSQSLLNLPLFRNYQISREGVREARTMQQKSGSISPSVFTSKRRICRGRE